MKEYLVRRRDGAPLAVLVAADRTGAELYGHRHLGEAWDGRLSEIDSLEEATAKLTAAYLGRGLNPAQASIAAEDTLALLRPRRIIVPEQQAGVSEALEASWRRLHPEFTDRQIEIAIGG